MQTFICDHVSGRLVDVRLKIKYNKILQMIKGL